MPLFAKYGLNENLLKSIKDLKFQETTDIQDKVIPKILSSELDIIATAQTGTGKTAAFGLPIIELTDNKNKNIESVILCPTRELCLQISKDLNSYSKYMNDYKIIPIYGGANVRTQIKGLKQRPKIIVCTPGRLNDLINRKRVNLGFVKYFVLDEADEMLSMGFRSEIDKILDKISLDRKIYLFSATLSKKVKKVTETYMNKPLMISTSPPNQAAETVDHTYYISSNKNKRYEIIKNIIDLNKNIYTIVFCRTRRETKDISNKLIGDHYQAKVLNGDLSQSERDQVMNQFRSKKINILVATDVASRGIDVDNLSHIINYNLPDDPEVYIHRSGRTGRAGNKGVSIALISKKESPRLKEIEKLSGLFFKQNPIPTDADIFKSQVDSFTDKVVNASIPIEKDQLIFKKLYSELSSFTKEEIIGKIISMNIESPKISKNIIDRKGIVSKEPTNILDNGMSKLTINIGRSDKITAEILIRLINKTIRSRNTEFGKIDIKRNYSIFEVNNKMKNVIVSKMIGIRYSRKKILISKYNEDSNNFSPKKKKNKKRFKKNRI